MIATRGFLRNRARLHARLHARLSTASSTGGPLSVLFENEHAVVMSMPVTAFGQNQSLVGCKETGEAAIVDAGGPPAPFLETANQIGLRVTKLLQTHAHIDHVSGLKETKDVLPDCPIFLHPLDKPVYDSVPEQAQMFGVECSQPLPEVDEELADGQTVFLGSLELSVHHCPGHSPGHVIFASKLHQFIIGGDLLFQGSIGRVDLPLADPAAMEDSIRKLYSIEGLNDDCLVIPGHMGTTTLGQERASNPYVRMWVP